ncbi:MAG: tRNA (N(6)-L-threonylcarbamoyladenosine(37)-C(2))-methylthiotransferase MtaB [Ethanoligenens sp.]
MKAAFYTLGCKVNQYETQIMEQSLRDAGFQIVPPDDTADVLVVNSCTVTSESDRKTRQMLRKMKKRNPDAVAVLCGCYVQASPEKAGAIAEADIVTGVRDRSGIAALVLRSMQEKGRFTNVSTFEKEEPFEPMRARGLDGHTRAFVKIEDGCQNFCTYCIIPFSRGPVRSKPTKEITEELAALRQQGYAEAVLVGINLSAYGGDIDSTLADAVEAADRAGLARIRLGSLSPLAITDAFIARAARCSSLCPHFHLSLQSGCADTLARMNRRYDPEDFANAVEKLRAAFPDCGITTDIIVGFPGETDTEFSESMDFAEQIGFSQVHVFPYSKRDGTRAAAMDGQISKAVKENRVHALSALCAQTQHAFWRRFIGRRLPVLFEQRTQSGLWEGFTPQYIPVYVRAEQDLHGILRDVHIEEVQPAGCFGRL